jgi:formate hydrogenlyase subunit 3/multisubunit Na+/H+ antiporter MnhD subunit
LNNRILFDSEAVTPAEAAETRARIRLFFPPLTIILVCLPLVFDLIPRNRWYGVRVREAMASDRAWYAANRIGGVALIGACLIWLVAAVYAPRYVKPIGVLAVLFTFLLLAATRGWTL